MRLYKTYRLEKSFS